MAVPADDQIDFREAAQEISHAADRGVKAVVPEQNHHVGSGGADFRHDPLQGGIRSVEPAAVGRQHPVWHLGIGKADHRRGNAVFAEQFPRNAGESVPAPFAAERDAPETLRQRAEPVEAQLEIVVAGNPAVEVQCVQRFDHDPAAGELRKQRSLRGVADVDPEDRVAALPECAAERGKPVGVSVQIGGAVKFKLGAPGRDQGRKEQQRQQQKFHHGRNVRPFSPAFNRKRGKSSIFLIGKT